MLSHGITFSEFGTRRRRSYRIQDLVVKTLIRANKDFSDKGGKLAGTSNVCSYFRLIVLWTYPDEQISSDRWLWLGNTEFSR